MTVTPDMRSGQVSSRLPICLLVAVLASVEQQILIVGIPMGDNFPAQVLLWQLSTAHCCVEKEVHRPVVMGEGITMCVAW